MGLAEIFRLIGNKNCFIEMLIVLASLIADAYIESNSPEFEAILLTCSEQRKNNLYFHILRFVHKKKTEKFFA